MKRIWVLLSFWVVLLTQMVAFAEVQQKRVALVIGNSLYQGEGLSKLANPDNDAKDISKALRQFGFDVIEKHNVSLQEMSNALAEFGRKSADSDAAFFYFAGHGLQVKGQNYLIPVNAQISSEASVPFQSLNVAQVLEELGNAKSRVNIVMLDACRNNPLTGKFRSGGTRGLAVPNNMPKGTVIVYATDPGNTALDGEGRNGVFTSGLLSAFNQNSKLTLQNVLFHASKEVEQISKGEQVPYVNGPLKLQNEFCFSGCEKTEQTQIPQQSEASRAETLFWADVTRKNKPNEYSEYLRRYPNGAYAEQAKLKLNELEKNPDATQNVDERRRWLEVVKQNKLEAYEAYIQQNPSSTYAKFAKTHIEQLRRKEDNERLKLAIVDEALQQEKTSGKKRSYEPEMVKIPSKNYEMGKYEVTQGQWKAMMGGNPSAFSRCGDDCPVESVSWADVQAYIKRLNKHTGKEYRLPTEAEWSFACYGASKTDYCGSNNVNAVAWADFQLDSPHPVGQKQANDYGLYDMTGNVWEWQQDCSDDACLSRVVRGCAWFPSPKGCPHSSIRRQHEEKASVREVGFRLARTLPVKAEGEHCFSGCEEMSLAKKTEQALWESAMQKNSIQGYEAYVKQYPSGEYIELARQRIQRIKADLNGVNKKYLLEPEMIAIPGKRYELGKYEVTQGQWRAVMGFNPSFFSRCGDDCPVEQVSWRDAQEYLQKLNDKTGKHYRLPTAAEWEYACSGGDETLYCGSKDVANVAWYFSNGGRKTHVVGQKQANAYGLYDMNGNVSEWLQDCLYDNCSNGRIIGGGSFESSVSFLRRSHMLGTAWSAESRGDNTGFRIARTLP